MTGQKTYCELTTLFSNEFFRFYGSLGKIADTSDCNEAGRANQRLAFVDDQEWNHSERMEQISLIRKTKRISDSLKIA